jgi:membrane protein DedA with SNARE-associated domain
MVAGLKRGKIVLSVFERLFVFVHDLILSYGYPGVFLLMVLERLVPPLPSEIFLPFAGFLTFIGILAAGTLGAFTGAVIQYLIGRKLGHKRLKDFICKYGKYFFVSGKSLDRAMQSFEKRGKVAIFAGQLIPGVRSLISFPAGIERLEIKSFLLLSLAGIFLWNLILLSAGFLLGNNLPRVLELLSAYQNVILLIVVAVLLVFIVKQLHSGSSPQEGCDKDH